MPWLENLFWHGIRLQRRWGKKRNSSPDLFFDLDARNKAAQAKQTKQINKPI
jgi:hypothetical protein